MCNDIIEINQFQVKRTPDAFKGASGVSELVCVCVCLWHWRLHFQIAFRVKKKKGGGDKQTAPIYSSIFPSDKSCVATCAIQKRRGVKNRGEG